jgi:hypothetical protein
VGVLLVAGLLGSGALGPLRRGDDEALQVRDKEIRKRFSTKVNYIVLVHTPDITTPFRTTSLEKNLHRTSKSQL